MSSSKEVTCIGTLRQDVYLSKTASPLDFCLGWCSNFGSSESGQIQSVKLLRNMVSNRTPYPRPPFTQQYTNMQGRAGVELNQREG
jgi:hypothetical protein